MENIQELITIMTSAIVAIISIIMAVINQIKKNKLNKENISINFIADVHNLADEFMLAMENSKYKGEEKKNAVIYAVTRKFPNADVDELANYIDKTIAFTREINHK